MRAGITFWKYEVRVYYKKGNKKPHQFYKILKNLELPISFQKKEFIIISSKSIRSADKIKKLILRKMKFFCKKEAIEIEEISTKKIYISKGF